MNARAKSELGGQRNARGVGAGNFAHWFDVSKVLTEQQLKGLKCATIDVRTEFDDDGIDETKGAPVPIRRLKYPTSYPTSYLLVSPCSHCYQRRCMLLCVAVILVRCIVVACSLL